MYIDTHCHLFDEYYKAIDLVIKSIKPNIIVISGINDITNKEVIELCNKHKNVYGTLGYHPSELKEYNDNSLKYIENNIQNPKIIGVGEIGLDYYWVKDNIDKQKSIFELQLKLAKKYNKAVVIHSRNSFEDIYNIIKKDEYRNLKKILHCFTYSLTEAEKLIEINTMIGIGGIITFKNSGDLVNVVNNIDIKHLLLETDSPYLAPSPHRGKLNNPNNIPIIAKKIAEIKNISVAEVYKSTLTNAVSQFDLKINL